MDNNEVLRSLRKALSANENTMAEIYSLSGVQMEGQQMKNLLKQVNESEFQTCEDAALAHFLRGLIIHRRGEQRSTSNEDTLSNNQILKKLRVAFELKDPDMHEVFSSGHRELNKQELKSLFRNEEHKNFVVCDDKLMRAFLKGLVERFRSENTN